MGRVGLAMFCLVEELVPMFWLAEETELLPMVWLVLEKEIVPVDWLVETALELMMEKSIWMM